MVTNPPPPRRRAPAHQAAFTLLTLCGAYCVWVYSGLGLRHLAPHARPDLAAVRPGPSFGPQAYWLALQTQKRVQERWAANACRAVRADLGRNPQDPMLHLRLGSLLEDRRPGQPEALQEFRTAVQLLPEDPRCHLILATALERRGRLAEAVTEYQHLVRSGTDAVGAHYRLGCALMRLGSREQARTEWRTTLNAARSPRDECWAACARRRLAATDRPLYRGQSPGPDHPGLDHPGPDQRNEASL